MTDNLSEEKTIIEENSEEESKPVEVYSEKAESEAPRLDDAQMRAAALAYARYLKDNDLAPGDVTFVEPESIGADLEEKAPEDAPAAGMTYEEHEPQAEEEIEVEPQESEEPSGETKDEAEKTEEPEKKTPKKKSSKKAAEEAKKKRDQKKLLKKKKARNKAKSQFLAESSRQSLAAVTDLHDRVQDGVDRALETLVKDAVRGAHRISSTYKNSRRTIGVAILITGILAAAILIVFDRFTVYEYAYNGKILGYVQEQEEVTDVLDIAGRKLADNTTGEIGVEFVANQNVTFNLVERRGKSTDDSDTVVNKLIYMTDFETEAYAVYDGDRVVAILKDQNDAEELLITTMSVLSTPDSGMELVSSKFINDLDVKPVNVLLGSVQSNAAAQEQMINGGEMAIYHIVEEGETIESLAEEFGVSELDIYDESNSNIATEVEQGDRVCVRSLVDPVSVEMVESGRIKETIEYDTIKKKTDEYYKGDTYLEQEGEDGIQIFEGTITKVAGEVTERKETAQTEIIKEKQDKIILVGTAKRPKTAATGTFIMPIKTYVVTSEFGGRWGRMHEGMDFGASTGTPIYASDGGTVVRAGYYGGYGNCIDVDHGNGYVTRYGHCSRILVSVGDMVYQGQEIGRVGSTGNSTGSHLHFEVRVNGSAQNPRKYVSP